MAAQHLTTAAGQPAATTAPRPPRGVAPDEVRRKVCTAALANRSYSFLTEQCPAEAKTLAQAECAGRKFTAIPEAALRSFCMPQAAEAMAAQPPPEEKKESKTKKALKGLLGR